MGIIDYLFDHTDLKFLLIDEVDKLNKKDQKVLLNVMETGILSDVT
jgi:replication-associated recombination protein RarA